MDEAETHDAEREDELRLVRALRARERGAFDRMYQQHHDRIWAFLLRLTGRRDEAADLFQETWLAAARHAESLEASSRLLPWLYTIARNKHRNARRFLLFDLRKRELSALEPEPERMGLDDEVEARERAAALQRAFYELPDASREVLLLVTIDGMSSADAAVVLGLKEDAVRKRLSRARAELTDAMTRLENKKMRSQARGAARRTS
ncbi:MAG: RNA polymerase sigma factor [Sandaracinaceae bacterium]|nr:RNA polymerase sigma factor [Sandaracinaceae bacterium]